MNALRNGIGWCQDCAEAAMRYASNTNAVSLYLHYRRDCKDGRWRSVRRMFEVMF